MSSNTTDKDKENEESGQHLPVSSNNEHLPIHPQLDAENVYVNPLPQTTLAPDVNSLESHSQPPTLQHLPTSFSSLDIQSPADLNAEPDQPPGAKIQSQPSTGSQPSADLNPIAYELPDTKVQSPPSAFSRLPADLNTKPDEFPDTSNPQAQPSSLLPETISQQPATAAPKPHATSSDVKPQNVYATDIKNEVSKITELPSPTPCAMENENSNSRLSFLFDQNYVGSESGTEEDQSAFMKELETFFRERRLEFKPPKFYGEGLNCLKLWRAVTRLGGYDKVTSCKLWRQVGESFKPPKTCTTVSWTFRGFYEKALLDYERHKTCGGEISLSVASHTEPMNIDNQASGSGRARRDAAARAMQGWHSQRVLGNGEVSDPIIKDKNSLSLQKRQKQLKSLGLLKRKKPSFMEHAVKAARSKPSKPQLDVAVVDIGQPADWVKINVQKTKDCFEVYALVPGLLREEVRVQSDPAGRLVISGEPEHPVNPWGVTPFKKVVSLPARIDPHQTSAVVTLHGQLFVRVPLEQSD